MTDRSVHDVLVHGAIAGLLAGAVVALWFLGVDLLAGRTLAAPTALAGAILGGELVTPGLRQVVTYALVHFGAFAFLGMGAAALLAATGTEPGWLVGLVFGLGVLDAVYYSALWFTGADIWSVLPAVHVLAANLLAGLALMTYLHRATHSESRLGFATLADFPRVARGILTGLVGAAAVALFFFLIDLFAGQPLRTPAALGSAVFLGATEPSRVSAGVGIVGGYTVLHLGVFALAGIGLVLAAEGLERAPGMWLVFTLAFVVLEALSILTLGLMVEPLLGTAGFVMITLGNLIAVASMGTWVWRTHPELRRRLLEEPVRTRV